MKVNWYFFILPGLQTINCFQSTKRCSVRHWRVSTTGIGENFFDAFQTEQIGENMIISWIGNKNYQMPGNLRKKPSKPNEDFAGRRWWRTWSALLLPLPLPLSTGSLGCIMSCILIHNERRIGEVPMEFFLSIFNISIFHFFRDTLCICRSRLWAAELYLQRLERKSPFLILMIASHIGPETLSLVRRYLYQNFFLRWTYTKPKL